MEAIHLLKYEKKTALAKPLSVLARTTFFQSWDAESIDLLVPVPLHVRRLREVKKISEELLLLGIQREFRGRRFFWSMTCTPLVLR